MWAKKKITNNPHNQNFLLGKNFHLRTLQKTYNYSQPNKFDETPWRGQPQFSIVLLCCTCFRETTYIDQRIFFSICRIASMKTRTGNGKTWSKQWKLAKCTSFICFIGGVEISVRQWTRIKHFGRIFTVLCKTTN